MLLKNHIYFLLTIVNGATLKDIVDKVNSDPDAKWLAGETFVENHENLDKYKYLMGTKLGLHPQNFTIPVKRKHHFLSSTPLPKNFMPTDKWPECEHSLTMIRDQGSCGSCWAFGASEAMSDRVCIATQGAFKGDISAEDILACCGMICGSGCNGGFPIMAWRYFKYWGVVTGGLYHDTASGCLPYEIEPCEHHTKGPRPSCNGEEGKTPKCPHKCIPEYTIPWKKDKHYAKHVYSIENDEETIMRELYENGPVESAISVYEDFMAYKGGVYKHVTGKFMGGHAIRLVGWGETEDGTKYWTLANSWNTDWGEDGFFRILRGVNEVGVEGENVAGIAHSDSRSELYGQINDKL